VRVWRVGVAAIGLLIGASTMAAPAGAAPQQGAAVAAKPGPGAKISDQGQWFKLDLQPGESITQLLHLTNPNSHTVTVNVEPVDGTTSNNTGAIYGTPGSPKSTTSRWIAVAVPQLTLQAHEERDVSFTVRVPGDAKPGQYLAGMSAAVQLEPDSAQPQPAPQGKRASRSDSSPSASSRSRSWCPVRRRPRSR
jgi:hypothetical protein